MKSSEHLNELAEALSKAQGVMQFALKDSQNPFFKSSYADLTSIVSCIQKPLSENGLSFVQAMRLEGDMKILETVLLHKSGQWISSDYPVNPTKGDPQSLGSATSYARRYGLQALIGVVADDDDDGEASMNRNQDQKKNNVKQEFKKPTQLDSDGMPNVDKFIDTHEKKEEKSLTAYRTAFMNRIEKASNGDNGIKEKQMLGLGFDIKNNNYTLEQYENFIKKFDFMTKLYNECGKRPDRYKSILLKHRIDLKQPYTKSEIEALEKKIMDDIVDTSDQASIPLQN